MSILGKLFSKTNKDTDITKYSDSDDWIKIGGNKHLTSYYKSSSVKIDNQNKTIEVWVKTVYTFMGKIDFLRKVDSIDKHKYNDINNDLVIYLLDFNGRKEYINQITFYSTSDNVIDSIKYPPEWINIIDNSSIDTLLNKIIKDYNLQI